jgi:hypothetical protein
MASHAANGSTACWRSAAIAPATISQGITEAMIAYTFVDNTDNRDVEFGMHAALRTHQTNAQYVNSREAQVYAQQNSPPAPPGNPV